jgi:ABC-type uncharacterized transport system permease subunit
MELTLLRLAALISLVPVTLTMFRKPAKRDVVYWSTLVVALSGTLALVIVRQSAGWSTGISSALWLTIVACLVFFLASAAVTAEAWRLTPLLLPYLIVLAVLATVWDQAPERPLNPAAPLAWIGTHIVVSIATYGLITLAAVAGLAAWIQGRALKAKTYSPLAKLLPSLADSEALTMRLLAISEAVLAIGLLTGIATYYMETGRFFLIDHKTLLTVAVFVVVGLLLLVNARWGVRGRAAVQAVLLAYLLLTLGYPGVKFVTDIVLAKGM